MFWACAIGRMQDLSKHMGKATDGQNAKIRSSILTCKICDCTKHPIRFGRMPRSGSLGERSELKMYGCKSQAFTAMETNTDSNPN